MIAISAAVARPIRTLAVLTQIGIKAITRTSHPKDKPNMTISLSIDRFARVISKSGYFPNHSNFGTYVVYK